MQEGEGVWRLLWGCGDVCGLLRLGLSGFEYRSQRCRGSRVVVMWFTWFGQRRGRCQKECVSERGSGSAYMLVEEGTDSLVLRPWCIWQGILLGWTSRISHAVGCVFLLRNLQFHVKLWSCCLSHLGSSFNGLVFGRFFLCNMWQGGLNKQPEPRRGAMSSVT